MSNWLGLFNYDPEPHTYLTFNNVVGTSNFGNYPSFLLQLSDTKRISERSAFTVMMLLGELGGLYGAIVGVPSIFISYLVQL